jgi:hypothetical protein
MTTWLASLTWKQAERAIAALTIASAALSLMVSGLRLRNHDAVGVTPLVALLGLLSGAFAWRGRLPGHAMALLVYGLQLASYYSYDQTQAYHLLAGLSVAFVVQMPSGVLVVNAFAVAMLVASSVLLGWRLRQAQ